MVCTGYAGAQRSAAPASVVATAPNNTPNAAVIRIFFNVRFLVVLVAPILLKHKNENQSRPGHCVFYVTRSPISLDCHYPTQRPAVGGRGDRGADAEGWNASNTR